MDKENASKKRRSHRREKIEEVSRKAPTTTEDVDKDVISTLVLMGTPKTIPLKL